MKLKTPGKSGLMSKNQRKYSKFLFISWYDERKVRKFGGQ